MTNYIVHATYRAPMFYYVNRRTNKLVKSCFYHDKGIYIRFSSYEDAVVYQAMRCL